MAISNILPRKTMRNRTRLQSMTERHDYDQKAEKTRDGELVSSYMCSPETAAKEFEESKQLYHQLTGRKQPPKPCGSAAPPGAGTLRQRKSPSSAQAKRSIS